MRVLLIHADFAPASLALLNLRLHAEADPAVREGSEIRILTFRAGDAADAVIARTLSEIAAWPPDVVGLSVYIWSRLRMYRLSAAIRRRLPGARILWGGPDVSDSDYAAELLAEHPSADVIVRDEGERTFRSLLRTFLAGGRDLAGIRGIAWRAPDGRIVTNEAVEFMHDLDEIPSVVASGLVDLSTYESFMMETFRGCYMGCSYCYWGGKSRRAYSMERILSDLRIVLAMPRLRFLWFFDSMFGYKKQAAKDILRFIIENRRHRFSINLFPNLDFLDDELCRLMKEAGVYIETGVQTINEEAYEFLNRKWDRAYLDRRTPMLTAHGLGHNAPQLILGLPGDSLEGFRRSVDYAITENPESIHIFPMSILPGTGYWRMRDRLQVTFEGEYRLVTSSMRFPLEDMMTGALIRIGAQFFVRWPGLTRAMLRLLETRPSLLFEHIGRVFVEDQWGIPASGITAPDVRERLLSQKLDEPDLARLDGRVLDRVFRDFYPDHRPFEPVVRELLRSARWLSVSEVVDAADLGAAELDELMVRWRKESRTGRLLRALADIFDVESAVTTWRRTGSFEPITFMAFPEAGPADFFGKTRERFRIIRLREAAMAGA